MLYIVPTPIGNLKDITLRAIETLTECDYILCEDTRHSAVLLHHYQIKKPLKSFHQFNEASKLKPVLDDLRSGLKIALISDGGTPGICDPGSDLIKACRKENIAVTALPGPCAITTAFCLVGSDSPSFQFLGFFPRREKEANLAASKAILYEGTTIFYESPQRILSTLQMFEDLCPERSLVVIRELSKTFEDIQEGSAQNLISHFSLHPPKGEIVLLVAGQDKHPFSDLSIEELLSLLQDTFHLTLSDAIKTTAHIKEVPRQTVYKMVHHDEEQEG